MQINLNRFNGFFLTRAFKQNCSGEIKGDPKKQIYNIENFAVCNSNSICFIKSKIDLENLSSDAGAILTTSEISKKINGESNFLIVEDPYLGFAKLTEEFFKIYEKRN